MKALDSSVSIWLRIAMYVTAVFFLNFFGAVSIELMVNCSKVLTGRWCLNHTSPVKPMAILGTTKYILIYILQKKFVEKVKGGRTGEQICLETPTYITYWCYCA